jgi:hypothetical protein
MTGRSSQKDLSSFEFAHRYAGADGDRVSAVSRAVATWFAGIVWMGIMMGDRFSAQAVRSG